MQYVTFFLSRIEPRPNTDILHMVSSCKRFNELPLGPNSLPTKLNCKIIMIILIFFYKHHLLKNIGSDIYLEISLTFGWSRTGTATRTAILIGLSRVMSIILLFSYGKCGIDDGEPRK